MMRDHGGNIDWAVANFGGDAANWVDLSTGINRVPYPVPEIPAMAWTALPTRGAAEALKAVAAVTYDTRAAILPVAGAQAAIQMIPRLTRPGRARVLGPTYNEHAAALLAAGWQVDEVTDLALLAGADLAVVVNPNNPDGKVHDPRSLVDLSGKVGRLVVDESFADPQPSATVAPLAGQSGLLVLRSFGKFYGLAGMRLGFVLGAQPEIDALSEIAGPWPVSGAALAVGRIALEDREWAMTTRRRLVLETRRIDALAEVAGWRVVGGTALFRLYDTKDATAAQSHLARAQIWSRRFPWHDRWLRLGLPGNDAEWDSLSEALVRWSPPEPR